SAAKVTGRELETTTASTAGTSKAKAKPSKRQAKTEGAMEPSADEFLKVIADQQEKLELAESQVELLTGNTLDFTLAEEAAASMEMAAPSMNDDLRREAVQVVREYQRLRAIEQETRFKSNHFPTTETRAEWAAAAENYRTAAKQIVVYYQNMMAQRCQVGARVLKRATQTMLGRWLRERTPAVEDFVVVSTEAGFERRDRGEHSTLDCDAQEVFLVLDEPAAMLLDLADGAPGGDEIYFESLVAQTKHLTAQGQGEVEPRPILGTAASSKDRAAEWAAWEKRGEELLELQAAKGEQADHACRLARAQWRRGRPFTLKVFPGVRRESLAELRKHIVKSSAAQLLLRKKGVITNLTDTERYYMANPGKGAARTAASCIEVFPIDLDNLEQLEFDEPVPDTGPEEPDQAGGEPQVRQPTDREKEGIMKLHRNLGHPDKATLARVLRIGGATEYSWKWVKQEFRCPTCESGVLPKTHRPAAVPRNFSANTALAIDLIDLPSWNGAETEKFLNMICLGANYQLLEKVRAKTPLAVWHAFVKSWARVFGFPQMILVDQGTEFLGDFRDRCSQMGVVLHVIGARAPQQNSRAERHGGLYKAMLQRAKWMNPPANADEYKILLREVESAKNRLSDRSGYSPAQRMMGETPKTTGELLSDELVESALLGDGPEIQKKVAARTAAQKAFAEVNNSEAIRRALRARPRTAKTFRPGDIVFVWRTWRAQGVRRACWTGPGVVVLPEGANAYVNMKGRLWKCANEHLRDGTSEEIRGVEAVNDIFQDMAQRFKKAGREHRVVTDLTDDPLPPGVERPGPDLVEAEGDARGLPRVRLEEPETPVPAPPLEPPGEQKSYDQSLRNLLYRKRAARLDGHENPGNMTPRYEPVRPSSSSARTQAPGPYQRPDEEEDYFEETDVATATAKGALGHREPKPHRDHWELMLGDGRLRRHHVKWRSAPFSPWEAAKVPVSVAMLSSERVQHRKFKNGDLDETADHWRDLRPNKRAPSKWRGYTDFFLTRKGLKEARAMVEEGTLDHVAAELFLTDGGFEVYAAKKTASDEVKERDISEEEWPSWRKADAEEWEKVLSSGAVVLRSLQESREIWAQLKKDHKLNRVIDSRIVRRRKPGEQLGEEATLKSRWVVRGDQDPDSAEIEVYAPTVCTQNLQVLLQTATSLRMPASCGDLKAAFTQSAPLVRAGGRLFVRIPRNGGPPGAHEDQLLEIVKGIYGLVDGPRHWRATLKDFVVNDLGYKQSRLDPTIFLLFQAGGLEGVLVIEVDDILSFGHKDHDLKMQQLRARFKFGKWKALQDLPDGTMFNGRRVQQGPDFVLKVDMAKFVEERLAPLNLERGRKSKPEEPVTEEEKQKARGLLGSMAWLAKEGRPDVAGATSMLASRMGSLKVKDLVELNKAVEEAKKLRDLALCFYPIPPEQLGWGAITDASWANHVDGSSQGALAVVAFDRALLAGQRAACSLIWWKSAKLKRKVGSTLAAETQSLLKGLGELMWAKAIYAEMTNEEFSLEKFRAGVQAQADVVLQKTDADPKLKDSLAVVDAKSLYDNLMKEGAQAQDEFTALDVAIAREKIDGLGVQVRWVEHQSMPVDSLTKIGAGKDALLQMIQSGTFKLEQEDDLLEDRLHRRQTGTVKPR
ncbi:RE2, partial [Symbiodinium sp. KB8]